MGDIDSLAIVDTLLGAGPLAFDEAIQNQAPAILRSLEQWEAKFILEQASSTSKAVRSDWLQYVKWCRDHAARLLPTSTQTLTDFLRDAVKQNYKLATLSRYVYTLRRVHRASSLLDPSESAEWPDRYAGIKQQLAARVDAYGRLDDGNLKKTAVPLVYEQVKIVLSRMGNLPRDLRDAALLNLASDTLLKASELVRVCVEDFALDDNGDWWLTARDLRDLPSQDPCAHRFVSHGAMERVRRWMVLGKIQDGPVFVAIAGRPRKGLHPGTSAVHALRPDEVSRIFRKRAMDAGIPDAEMITSHSSRLGSLVDLANEGENAWAVADAGGWKQALQVSTYMTHFLNAKKPVR